MANKVVWNGLDEYRAALAALPEACTGEAEKLVIGAANGAAVAIRSAYPVRTGNLRDNVRVQHIPAGGRLRAASIVKNTAKHAVIFEYGTQARHTKLGANRGSMPPGRVFLPRIMQARRRLIVELKDMVKRHGATQVVGDA